MHTAAYEALRDGCRVDSLIYGVLRDGYRVDAPAYGVLRGPARATDATPWGTLQPRNECHGLLRCAGCKVHCLLMKCLRIEASDSERHRNTSSFRVCELVSLSVGHVRKPADNADRFRQGQLNAGQFQSQALVVNERRTVY